jgi:hypothetical protein
MAQFAIDENSCFILSAFPLLKFLPCIYHPVNFCPSFSIPAFSCRACSVNHDKRHSYAILAWGITQVSSSDSGGGGQAGGIGLPPGCRIALAEVVSGDGTLTYTETINDAISFFCVFL